MDQPGSTPAVVAAKYARPRTDHAALREEFLRAFASAARKRLLLVGAPAGYGKTTSIANALDRLDLCFVWYKLDVLDHDPVVFFSSLGEALRRRFPDFGEVLRERVRSSSEVPFPLEEMTAVFVAECERNVETPVHIVLDDYHEASDSRELNRALDYLIANAPDSLRFVILMRYEPAFSTAKLRLDDQLALLGAEDLRFTVSQATDVVSARSGVQPAVEDIERLVEITEGWPAAIVLAGLTLDWLDLDSLQSALADPRLKQDIYSYLAEQVFLREDDDTRHFLERTCCLEYVNAGLGDRLVGGDSAHRHLNHLSANRVFTFPTAEAGTYRYHNLFRDYLRQRCLLAHGEPAFRRLQVETAEALEGAGELELAVELLLRANEPTLAVAAISRMGQRGLDGVGLDRLESWLRRLRPGPAQNHAWVGLISSQVAVREGLYSMALSELEDSIARFHESGDRWGLYQALSTKEFTQFWSSDYESAIATSRSAFDVAPGPTQAVHSLLSMGSAAAQIRDWDTMEHAYAQAEALATDAETEECLRARVLRALGLFFQGDFWRARQDMSATLTAVPKGLFRASVLESIGAAETALAEYPSAIAHLAEAYRLTDSLGWAPGLPLVIDNLGFCLGCIGRVEAGIALCQAAAEDPLMQSDPAMHALCLTHIGTIHRRQGRLDPARIAHENAVRVASRSRNSYVELNCRLNHAFTELLATQTGGDALAPLAHASRQARLRFLELKAQLFAGLLQLRVDGTLVAAHALLGCVLAQVRLGHFNLLAQELAPHDGLVEAIVDLVSEPRERSALVRVIAGAPGSARLLQRLAMSRSDVASTASDGLFHQAARQSALRGELDDLHAIDGIAVILRRSDCRVVEPGAVECDVLSPLSRREKEVLGLMAAGLRNPEIASRLVVSPATVKTHVNHIFTKLGVRDRVHAILLYRESVGGREW